MAAAASTRSCCILNLKRRLWSLMTSRISGDPVSHAHSYACVAADSPLQRLFPSLNLLRRTELFSMQSGVLWAVQLCVCNIMILHLLTLVENTSVGTLQLLDSVGCLQFTKRAAAAVWVVNFEINCRLFWKLFHQFESFFNENKMVSSCFTLLGTDGWSLWE